MNKFKFYFILSFITISLFSCKKNDDDTTVAPPRDRAEQYAKDLDSIETYLKTHYVTTTLVDGLPDVSILPIPVGGTQVSVWDNEEYPLKSKMVKSENRVSYTVDGVSEDVVDYKVYYLIINPGSEQGKRPATIDSCFTSYRGWRLDNEEFDRGNTSTWSTFPALTEAESAIALIPGYRALLPELRAAIAPVTGGDGVISFPDAGVGVVFIPSGLGYYNVSRTNLPAYTPIVFTIRLNAVRFRDHDRDGILSYNEDLNHDGDYFNDDTDGDNTPDFLDIDDDNDNFPTKFETQRPTVEGEAKPTYYSFDGAAVDDPATAYDETQGIPSCALDFTSPTRLRRHLDSSCH